MKITNRCDEWEPGNRIDEGHGYGRWEILRVLAGGMGRVYIVFDQNLGCQLAMKGFQREKWELSSRDIEGRFRREALAWVNINAHPNVVKACFVRNLRVTHTCSGNSVYGKQHETLGTSQPFLFLEYVEGNDLSHWIGKPELTRDLGQVLNFAVQFCDGMEHVLANGIVAHRDIKPGNCMVTRDRVLKVTDFGLAKALEVSIDERWSGEPTEGGENLELSRTGTAAGTPPYMAPEQFEDVKHVDVAADVYSFGVMLFQMLTGRLPFVAQTFAQFREMHRHAQPPHLALFSNHAIVGQLNELIHGCLMKRPGERISSFAFLRKRLAHLHAQVTGREISPVAAISTSEGKALVERAASLIHLHGKKEEILRLYDEALRLEPSSDYVWLKKGEGLARYGLRQEALSCFETALELNPANADAWLNRAHALAHLDRHQESLESYEEVLRLLPRTRAAYIGKAWRLAALGRKREGLSHLEAELKRNPLDQGIANALSVMRGPELITPRANTLLARVCYEAFLRPGQPASGTPEGKQPFNVTANLDTEGEGLLFEPIQATFEQFLQHSLGALKENRYAEAAACLERCLEINPTSVQALGLKGIVLSAEGRKNEALAAFDAAIPLQPRFGTLWVEKAQVLRDLGRNEEAFHAYRTALDLQPQLEKAWSGYAALLAESHQPAEALAAADRALAIDPKSEIALSVKGFVLSNLGDHAQALSLLDAALQILPDSANTWFNKGAVLLNSLNQPSDALACFERAQELKHRDAAEGIRLCRERLASAPQYPRQPA